MNYLKLICALMVVAPTLQAQVYKCTDPKTGNLTFSDGACASSHRVATVHLQPANSMDSTEDRRAAYQLEEQQYEAQKSSYSQNYYSQSDNSQQNNARRYESNIERQNELRMIVPYAGSGGRLTAAQLRARSRLMGVDSPEPERQSSYSTRTRTPPPPPPSPSVITNCDGAGCWDNQGTRYNKAAGDTYFRSTGGICQAGGGQMNCN